MSTSEFHCPLCFGVEGRWINVNSKPIFRYWLCLNCELLSMSPEQKPDTKAEKKRYDNHENDETSGYRNFLKPVVDTLCSEVPQIERAFLKGIDFGCGPAKNPLLAQMLKEESFQVDLYDPYYKTEIDLKSRKYDFVTCTEVVEHFHNPLKSWGELAGLLKPRGILVVMTNLDYPNVDFSSWTYRRDETHIAFHTKATMLWIAAYFALDVIKIDDKLSVFRKSDRIAKPIYIGDLV